MTRVLVPFLGVARQAFHEANFYTRPFIRLGCGTKCLALHDVPENSRETVMRGGKGMSGDEGEQSRDQQLKRVASP